MTDTSLFGFHPSASVAFSVCPPPAASVACAPPGASVVAAAVSVLDELPQAPMVMVIAAARTVTIAFLKFFFIEYYLLLIVYKF